MKLKLYYSLGFLLIFVVLQTFVLWYIFYQLKESSKEVIHTSDPPLQQTTFSSDSNYNNSNLFFANNDMDYNVPKLQSKDSYHVRYETQFPQLFPPFYSFPSIQLQQNGPLYWNMQGKLILQKQHYDLLIVIPTLPRFSKNDVKKPMNYLQEVLEEYEIQIPTFLQMTNISLLIVVQTYAQAPYHEVFHQLKQRYWNHPNFLFLVSPVRWIDPFKDIPNYNYKQEDNYFPGHLARQQNCDIITLTNFILNTFSDLDYFMYSEDDFVPCEGTLLRAWKSLQLIQEYHHNKNMLNPNSVEKGLCALRMGGGMGGLIFPKLIVTQFLHFATHNIDLFPIDILALNFMVQAHLADYTTCVNSGKTFYSSNGNLMEHIGEVSNWEERSNKEFARQSRFVSCGGEKEIGWFLGEEYKLGPRTNCTSKLVSPCV